MPKYFKGFTLVELLVVISIISILATIAVITFSSFQQKGRDARRKSDLGVIQSALEQYHADQGYYPKTGSANGDMDLTHPLTGLKDPNNSRTYLATLPSDPTSDTTTPYFYEKLPSSPECNNDPGNYCTKYCLYANLEKVPTDTQPCTKANYNYAVVQP